MVEHSPDGRYIIVDGRRWRATDPTIPDTLRSELVSELMAARRAVAGADGPEEETASRRRVDDAKVALGERGEPWWEDGTAEGLRERSAAAARALLTKRGPSKTICPSDVARVVASPDWQEAMDDVREILFDLADRGTVVVLSGGRPVPDPRNARGPIRIGAAS